MSDWREILKALDGLEWEGAPATVELIARRAHVDEATARRLLEAAEATGFVSRGVHDWALTARGRLEVQP